MTTEEKKTYRFQLGCLGLFILLYVTPGLLGSVLGDGVFGTRVFSSLFYVIIALMAGLWLAVPSNRQNSPAVKRLKYFSVMSVLLAFAFLLIWIGTGMAGGTFTFERSVGMGMGPAEGGVTVERPLSSTTGRIIFGGMGLFIGGLTLRFGIPYGRRLMKETSRNKRNSDEMKVA